MNILYVGSVYEIFNIKLAKSIASSNFNNKVSFINVEEQLSIEEKNNLENLNINYLGSIPSFSAKNIFRTFKAVKKINNLIKVNKIGLAHISFATPYALWIPYLKCKTAITTRGSDILIVLPKLANSKSFQDKILFSIFKKAFKKADLITSTSTKQIESINQLFGNNIKPQLIRTGVPTDLIKTSTDPLPKDLVGNKIIFSPRYISQVYNTHVQVQAINLLPTSLKEDYTFVFLKPKENLIDKVYLEKVITLLDESNAKYLVFDKVDQKTIFSIYKNSTLVIMNPVSDGTPSSALEAMAAKCPLIMGELDYDKDLFKDVCFRLTENTAENLAQLIEKALENYPPELIEKAFETVISKGDIINEMGKLNVLYQQLTED